MSSPNAASVAIIKRNSVLLIKRAYPPYRGLWTLPGGRLEHGETAEQAAARELMEEMALVVENLLHVETQTLTSSRGGWRLAVFVTDSFVGDVKVSDEIATHAWVERDVVSQRRTTSRLGDVINRAFARLARGC